MGDMGQSVTGGR